MLSISTFWKVSNKKHFSSVVSIVSVICIIVLYYYNYLFPQNKPHKFYNKKMHTVDKCLKIIFYVLINEIILIMMIPF